MVHGQAGRASARVLTLLLGVITLSGSTCFKKPGGFDAGPSDAGVDAGTVTDAGTDAGRDAGPTDGGPDAGPPDSGPDAGPPDSGDDAGPIEIDGGPDAGPDGGPDAGPPDGGPDAGPPDAGVDAGPEDGGPICDSFTEAPPNTGYTSNAGLGDPCDLSIETASANCGDGLECRRMEPGSLAFCTTACGSGFDCAPGGGGYCVSGFPNFCLPVCDVNHPCPQNLACDHNVCVPNCNYEPPTYCLLQFGEYTMCNAGSGICEKKTCSTSNDCPANGTCNTSRHECFYDCHGASNFCCRLGPDQLCGSSGHCEPGEPYLVTGNALVLPTISLDAGTNGVDAGPPCEMNCGVIDGGVMGPDAGPDTSFYDGGPLPDAGRPLNATNAMPCAPASPFGSPSPQQGTCAAQHTCITLNAAGFCSQSCANDGQCETNGGLVGKCFEGTCVMSCDASHGCPSGSACQTKGGAKICLPDCRREWPNYCHTYVEENTTCDSSDGLCKQLNCPATSCPSGSVCDTTRTPSVCRVNCRPQPSNFCWNYMHEEGPWCATTGICSQ